MVLAARRAVRWCDATHYARGMRLLVARSRVRAACCSALVAALPLACHGQSAPRAPRDSVGLHVAVGEQHSCAIRPDRTVWCWGDNAHGQLGDGSPSANAPAPVRVTGLRDAVQLSAARFYSCAVRADGSVWCWGDEGFGRVSGRGDVHGAQRSPRAVQGLTEALQVATGENHACARRRDGSVWCWGRNTSGELGSRGVESADTEMRPPGAVPGLLRVSDVTAFAERTCAVSAGELWCWGRGAHRIANDGSSGSIVRAPAADAEIAPERVAGVTQVERAFLGPHNACALRADGSLWCWGANQCRQTVPDGRGEASASVPALSVEGERTAALSGGATCVIDSAGALRCWGCGGSAHARGGAGTVRAPAVVQGVTAFDVSLYGEHGCAIGAGGRAWCWGNSWAGQLGRGPAPDGMLPAAPVRW